MKAKNLLKYLLYILFVIIFLYIKTTITKEQTEYAQRNLGFDSIYLQLIISFLLYFVFGILIAGKHLLNEYNNKGQWMINHKQLLILGLPLLYISLFWFLFYSNNIFLSSFSKPLEAIMSFDKTNVTLVQILFGYNLATSVYRKKQS